MDLFGNPSLLKSNIFETAIWASKLVLMSMGVLSTLALLKVAIIPFTFELLLSTFPRFWVSARTLISPPFVYVIVNFIIITIAASSNFHHKSLPFSDSPPNDPKHTMIYTAIAEHEVSDTTHQPEPEKQSNEQKRSKKTMKTKQRLKTLFCLRLTDHRRSGSDEGLNTADEWHITMAQSEVKRRRNALGCQPL